MVSYRDGAPVRLSDVATVIERLQTAGERCFEIGEVVAGQPGVDYV